MRCSANLRLGWQVGMPRPAVHLALLCGVLCVLSSALGLTAQKSPAATTNANGYRIAGTVLNFVTGDPVQRAVVSVLAEDDNHAVASVVSDTEGRFAFEGLPAAKYPLTASKRGFRTVFYDDHEGYNTAIVTGPDQDTAHLIFFLVPGAILHGVVSADGGDPVERARVMLFEKPRHGAPDERIRQLDTTVTDDTGAYEFGNLTDGDYLVAVSAQPWYATHRSSGNTGGKANEASALLDVAYPVTYFDSTMDEASATAISLTKGAREEADINLHAVPALRITIDAAQRAEGRPARQQLQQIVFGTQIPAENAGFFGSARRGTPEFDGLAPGHYELTEGNPPHIEELDATESGPVEPDSGGAVAVTGTLRILRGGMPPEDSHLVLLPQEGATSHANLFCDVHNGRFSFESVPAGPWTVTAYSAGSKMPVLTVGAGAAMAGDIFTVRDRPLNLAVTLGEGTVRIDGFARRSGKGFAGAMIVLVPRLAGNFEALARRDQSDSDGSFSLHDVVPGQYTLVAIEDGWELEWGRPGALSRYLPGGTAVTVNDRSGDVLHLSEPVAVQAR
jgi:hypothetical protein